MRLTQIKLSGFKSFVDPTLLHVPGNLVGVVGPNGCGKSNIIDAVRWVLGESRASALRGDSMQDVIFNGSTLRKPVGRASVELVFDNSLGRAAGQWSQYAEISVKRILTREGDSSYYINNSQVRRRDIHDIFLGTGLGPRAYAIIEQGMISRIIEAKPEELRVFLEEAAGVSKYKDRRRETENRLSDTRENLARVGDIREELSNQIGKLDQQAKTATRFTELSQQRDHMQHALWILKRRDAEDEGGRYKRMLDRITVELEEVSARARHLEANIEVARSAQYESADRLSLAQGEYFTSNSEVSRIEGELRHVSDLRQRLESEKADLDQKLGASKKRQEELAEALKLWQQRHVLMTEKELEARRSFSTLSSKLPEIEESVRATKSATLSIRDELATVQRSHSIQLTHREHSNGRLQALIVRKEALSHSISSLAAIDEEQIAKCQGDVEESLARARDKELALKRLEDLERVFESQVEDLLVQRTSKERESASIVARIEALRGIQRQTDGAEELKTWLSENGLSSASQLWQGVHVAPEWERAVELVLGERLRAVCVRDRETLTNFCETANSQDLVLFSPGEGAESKRVPGLRPLLEVIAIVDPVVEGVLSRWLHGHYLIDGVPGAETLDELGNDVTLVNRDGRQFGRFDITMSSGTRIDNGFLARQREIGELLRLQVTLQGELHAIQVDYESMYSSMHANRKSIANVRVEFGEITRAIHDLEVRLLKLGQERDRVLSTKARLESELTEVFALHFAEESNYAQIDEGINSLSERASGIRTALEKAQNAQMDADSNLEAIRQEIGGQERHVQEAGFALRECVNKVDELQISLKELGAQFEGDIKRLEGLQIELVRLADDDLRNDLEIALRIKVSKEATLSEARIMQTAAVEQLRALESERAEAVKSLDPLREKVADLKLKEQAAFMSLQQYDGLLDGAGLSEEAKRELSEKIDKKQKSGDVQAEIVRLNSQITDLGLVNMAALEELSTATDRKSFLDAQADDLAAALETLESAIRRIDRETRELMQQTFDAVNEHFGKLFPQLFGGGEARLVMTGDEILDAGVQVVARPPGKKNSTIHLLSGGEKAMTAISLVFSFFQLNAAPFCLLDEVDAPLDDANTSRFCELVKKMSQSTQFLYISHNKLSMEMASHLVGVTMQEQGVSRVVAVDIDSALQLREPLVA